MATCLLHRQISWDFDDLRQCLWSLKQPFCSLRMLCCCWYCQKCKMICEKSTFLVVHFKIKREARPIFDFWSSSKTISPCLHKGHRKDSITAARIVISISRNPFKFSSSSSLLSSDKSLDSAFILRTEAAELFKVSAFSVSTCSVSLHFSWILLSWGISFDLLFFLLVLITFKFFLPWNITKHVNNAPAKNMIFFTFFPYWATLTDKNIVKLVYWAPMSGLKSWGDRNNNNYCGVIEITKY